MIRPGPRNLITDVPGISVGNAEDRRAVSGVTVVLPEQRAVAGVAALGGAPGTRETDALDPSCLVEAVDAVVIAGGSVYGLDAAGGVASWLGAHGRGYRIGSAVAPIVPAAILFDLANGGDKQWGEEPPYRRLGREAAEAAAADFALGNAGAGLGARAGRLKGGLGSASFVLEGAEGGFAVGALAAVNCLGSVLIPGSRTFWAWPLEQDDEFGGPHPQPAALAGEGLDHALDRPLGASTTLAVIATDLALDKAQAERIAIMAHDGLARAVRPAHTPLDGDCVFVLATGARELLPDPVAGLARLGMLAADCLARAVARGVYEAETLGAMPGYRTLEKTAGRSNRRMQKP